MEENNISFIEKRLKSWSDSLLDLSRRNPSLNFVPYLKSGKKKPYVFDININTNDLFNSLVMSQKTISINELGLKDESNDEDFSSLFESNNLIKKFTRLKRDTENILEERGTHVLYLTIGSLKWKEEKISEEYLTTPIIFIPVSIQNSKSKDRFGIQISDLADIELNPTFSYILKKLYNIDLDQMFNDLLNKNDKEINIIEILELIESEISKVISGEFKKDVWLSKFWFEKLILFNDIQKNSISYIKNQNIRNICGEGTTYTLNTQIELDVLKKLAESRNSTDIFEVLDADSSQRVAIEAAISGKSFILVGPPGTGKSQTITNIISECLARDKKVLFISEKLAALKVVEKKLIDSNLGRFSLSIHGRDIKKKIFYSELYDWYEAVLKHSYTEDQMKKVIFEELNEKKNKLNDYANSLSAQEETLKKIIKESNGEVKSFDLTTHYIQSALIEFELKNTPSVRTKLNIDSLDELKYKNQKDLLNRAIAFKDILLHETYSDWFLTKLDGPFTSELHENINETLLKLKNIDLIEETILKILSVLGINKQLKLNNIPDIILLINVILDSPQIDPICLNYQILKRVFLEFEKDKTLHLELKHEKEKLNVYFRDELLEQDLKSTKINFIEKFEGSTFRFLNKDYWIERRKILKFKSRNKKTPLWIKDVLIYDEIERGIKIQGIVNKIKFLESDLKTKYASFYNGENTNWDEIIKVIKSLEIVFNALKSIGLDIENETLPEGITLALSSIKSPLRDRLKQLNFELENPLKLFHSGFNELENYFNITFEEAIVIDKKIEIRPKYIVDNLNIGSKFLYEVKSWVLQLQNDINVNPSLLERWFYFKKIKEKINLYDLTDFIGEVSSKFRDEFHLLSEIYEKRIFETIYMRFENKFSALANFQLEDQTKTLKDFKNLDKQSLDLNKERLYNLVTTSIKEKINDENEPAIRLIKKLGNQKYPRTPIRTAIKEAGKFILNLKPCWMMSPISVSQYCPPDSNFFDVVIFDEASQVRPADAIGAIFRGKQIIVVGDQRQLPPTNFFQKIAQEEEDLDKSDDTIEESIIDEIKSKSGNFIEIPLRWHYRSKSEDLFAFANHYIYGDLKLITFPNASDRTKDGKPLGVRHLLVEDGIYDRGITRKNELEADKVADLVIEHFANYSTDKNNPNYLSLGVIAFSSAQEKAIIDSLYRKKKDFLFLENILDDRDGEHFFVKNLETVQGDERDCIIISVGYGKDKDGKMTGNFGPVNQEGGERRLNVAITRARKNLILVSSFTPNDVVLNTNQKGPQLLLKYIQYSIEGKNLLTENQIEQNKQTPSFNSFFDELIYKKLKKQGLSIKTKIGCSDLKIDLGIINPFEKDNFLFSIETDGPSYHLNTSCRDRERLKSEILEDRGWDIYRVWTREWMKNPEVEYQKIVDKYNKLIAELKTDEMVIDENGIIDFGITLDNENKSYSDL